MKEHCKRCGRCCVFVHVLGEEPHRCRFLIGEVGKITSCRVYLNRFEVQISEGVRCFPRHIQEKLTPLGIKECTQI